MGLIVLSLVERSSLSHSLSLSPPPPRNYFIFEPFLIRTCANSLHTKYRKTQSNSSVLLKKSYSIGTFINFVRCVLFSRVFHVDPPCLGEMTAVMACWKLHSFDDSPCKKEIQAFNICTQEVVSFIYYFLLFFFFFFYDFSFLFTRLFLLIATFQLRFFTVIFCM